MELAAQYVLRLVCCGILCAMILALAGESGSTGRILRLLCGLVMVFLALSPLRELDFRNIRFMDPAISYRAEQAAEAGDIQAKQAMASIIKDQSASYILTKAAELSLDLAVTVELDPETMVPIRAKLTGQATPYEKQILCDYITRNLGIERSFIQWNP